MNADPEHDADCYAFDLKTVEEYRKRLLAAPVKDGKSVLEGLTSQRKEEAEDDDMEMCIRDSDNIWGIGLSASSPEMQGPQKWRGQNLLGFALMEVRDELRRVTQNEMLCDWSKVWEQ